MRTCLIYTLLCLSLFSACRKTEGINTDGNARLSFSFDTVLFDTVFTAFGSTNKRIKVYNRDARILNISDISLGGGDQSFFSLIVNGEAANNAKAIRVLGNDSISIFIKVTINPNNSNQPFIVEDSIIFNTNGNRQAVRLIAYGQNAVFLNNLTLENNTTFTPALPYIVNKNLTVPDGISLNILPGTKVLFHGNATMHVKGSLKVQGNVYNPVLFASDRTEPFYENESGQWSGIRFYPESINSTINYATIKNAVIGISSDSLSLNELPKLLLTNTVVKNMSIAGFTGYHTSLKGFNNLFYNCGQYLVYGIGGGSYDLKHNTFAGYNPAFGRKTPALYFSDLHQAQSFPLSIDIKNNLICLICK